MGVGCKSERADGECRFEADGHSVRKVREADYRINAEEALLILFLEPGRDPSDYALGLERSDFCVGDTELKQYFSRVLT